MSDISAVPESEELRNATTNTAASERDVQASQDEEVTDSATAAESDVDDSQVQVLPGTGGPDDVGEIEVDPSELNLSGDSIPGHPKPGSPEDTASN
ncbi:hypothetical protein [Marisediminicola senii]|uniref:hypothetical protein n=1 Tax=Marisediminicola senii TaxID=2711233 RepID=UPI0013EC16FE|nr:hypothetical protein [Marisediminicola senii]